MNQRKECCVWPGKSELLERNGQKHCVMQVPDFHFPQVWLFAVPSMTKVTKDLFLIILLTDIFPSLCIFMVYHTPVIKENNQHDFDNSAPAELFLTLVMYCTYNVMTGI